MSSSSEDLTGKVLGLPQRERARLAGKLLRSLDPDELGDGDVDALWDAEIKRRVDELKAGGPTVSLEAAVQKMLDRENAARED